MAMEEQRPLLGVRDADADQGPGGDADLEDAQRGPAREKLSCKEWTAETLEAPATHSLVIALIAIDASCVLADLVYTFLTSDCPAHTPGLAPALLSSAAEQQPAWLEALADVSLAITAFFLVEIPLALWCFGLEYYSPFWLRRAGPRPAGEAPAGAPAKEPRWRPYAALHLFDALVVIATFVLEVVLRGAARELAGLLVLLRLWRLVKLVGGIAVGAGELSEELSKQLEDSEHRVQQLEQENRVLRDRLRLSSAEPMEPGSMAQS